MKDTYSKVVVPVPSGWTVEFYQEMDDYAKRTYKDDPDQPKFLRHGVFAGNCTDYSHVHEIELRSNYNGGGPTAFGGAKHWPCITARIPFKADEYELRGQFAKDLGEFVNKWMKERNR